jgi:hypothetical protein
MGLTIKFGIPHSHQDQSPIERSFREVRRHLVPVAQEVSDTYRGSYMEISNATEFDIYSNIESVIGLAPSEAYSPLLYSPTVKQYLSSNVEEGISGREVLDKVVEIQDKIINNLKENQELIWKKKKAKVGEGVSNPAEIETGMHVLLIPEDYDKHEYRKSGPWKVVNVKENEETGQWHAHLQDPIEQVENFSVHISRVVPYHIHPLHGDLKEIRGKDIKETVVLRTEDHTCVGSEKIMADYDFQCLWANGIKSWIPYSEASKLWLFET